MSTTGSRRITRVKSIRDRRGYKVICKRSGRTASIAFLTRSDVMRPLLVRFLIRAAFVEPVDIHAIDCGFVGAMGIKIVGQ